MDPRVFDKRVVRRNLNNGRITKDEYEKYMNALPDMNDQAEPVTEKLFGNEEEDDDDEASEPSTEEAAE